MSDNEYPKMMYSEELDGAGLVFGTQTNYCTVVCEEDRDLALADGWREGLAAEEKKTPKKKAKTKA